MGVDLQNVGYKTNFVPERFIARNFSKDFRIQLWTEDQENMTLSNYSDSSSDMLLSSSSLSSTPLSDISSSTSLLSSPQPTRKISQKAGRKQKIKSSRNSTYKHIPHRLKPPHLVAKRNARERKRVQAVNCAFSRLRKHIPVEPRHRRLSKVKTLRFAIEYIQQLQELITNHDMQTAKEQHTTGMLTKFKHHNYHHHEHRHLILNTSAYDVLFPQLAEMPPEGRISSSKDTFCIRLQSPNSNLQANHNEQRVFPNSSSCNFVPFSQYYSSCSPESAKLNVSTIHNFPSCLHNINAADCVRSHPFPVCLSLTDYAPSANLDHSSSNTLAPNETQEMMTFEQEISHFTPFRQSFLHPGIPTSSDMPVCPSLGSHFATSSTTPPPTSVDTCSNSDTNNSIMSAGGLSYIQKTLRPPPNHAFPQVSTQIDCNDHIPQFRMCDLYPNKLKVTNRDCPLRTSPQHLLNNDPGFSFAHSNFD